MADKSDWDIDSWKTEDKLDRLDDELAQLKAEVARLREQLNANCLERDALMIEVARLTAELDEFKKSNDMWFLESKKAYAQKHEALAERDAAVVQGLEIAKGIIFAGAKGMKPWSYRLTVICDAITAEIAARKKTLDIKSRLK